VTATALLRAGIDAHVHEAYSGPSEGIGSGLALAPNVLAALDLLDMGEAVRRIALPVAHMRLAVGGREHVLPPLADQPPLQAVDRGELHRTLHDHAVAAGVPFSYDKRLT